MDLYDWYYIYSQRYYPFHLYLQDKIPKESFNAKGLFVDQSVFDEHLYKHEGEHFFSRITIKIEVILDLITTKRRILDERPFFFSDCDILVGDLVKELLVYPMNFVVDMWFQREQKESCIANPGFILIRPNERTEQFWKDVLTDMKTIENTMEMVSINKILKESSIIWNFFLTLSVCSSITRESSSFGIYHVLCSCDSREIDIGNKLFEASMNGHSMQKYVDQTQVEFGRLWF